MKIDKWARIFGHSTTKGVGVQKLPKPTFVVGFEDGWGLGTCSCFEETSKIFHILP
jgi:hypothetical protein